MSSYLTFKIISIVVMIALLIVIMVKKKSDKRDERSVNTINNVNDPEESRGVTKTNEHPEVEPQDKIDYKPIHDEMYYVEYKLIPHFVEMFKDQPTKSSQIILTIYENLVTLQNHLRKVNPFAFGNISCEICGDIENECLAVLEFPKPFDMPLAKYGAIYFNKPQQKYKYWTLELSMNGNYVLGSKTAEGHANYGQKPNLSKEEFIHEVCRSMGVDETTLQPRNMICRKNMLDLTDLTLKNAITTNSHLIVCFYDFNQPSQVMIQILDQLALEYSGKIVVGLYDIYGGHENAIAAVDYNTTALPTLLLFKEGKLFNRHLGVCQGEELRTIFDNLLKA